MRQGALRDSFTRLQRFIAMVPLLVLGACSIAGPIGGLGDEDEVATGSLKGSESASFVDSLTAEDWRRARAALAVALDPEGNGSPVRWDNPETKASGSFAASGAFFVKNHLVCRPFGGGLSLKGVVSSPRGLACRRGPGDWVIDDHAAAAASPSPAQAAAASPAGLPKPRTTRSETPKALKAGALF